ncbi:MAG: hypothetical protein K0R57_2772 [Paenibacillaceae bacterium]|jgi:hypothetical protein|nr:hypothetical protein [Paenibacillaceae bacterium]
MQQEGHTMDIMGTWVYKYVLNSWWFLWTIAVLIIAGNFLAPIMIWLIMAGKRGAGGKKSADEPGQPE